MIFHLRVCKIVALLAVNVCLAFEFIVLWLELSSHTALNGQQAALPRLWKICEIRFYQGRLPWLFLISKKKGEAGRKF